MVAMSFLISYAALLPANLALSDCPCARETNPCFVIAQKCSDGDPHGLDPHGLNPHDEQHDPRLPARKEEDRCKAPKNVYGGEVPNTRQPY